MSPTRTANRMRQPVTIVLPFSDHWSSLERCILSVLAHVDLRVHKLILINDCGPHADTLERLVLQSIRGRHGIEYHRNEHALGYAATCNRAVEELDRSDNDVLILNSDAQLSDGALDELIEVLNLDEHHAIVCSRSNDAGLATIPYFQRADDAASLPRSRAVFEAVAELVPRYYLAPVVVESCGLVRRSFIVNYGLFDLPSDLGYSSAIANRAFVARVGRASFPPPVGSLADRPDHETVVGQSPLYSDAMRRFIRDGYAAADVFADVFVGSDSPSRAILIDLHHLSLAYNGSTRLALAFLETLCSRTLPPSVTVTIAAQQGAIDFFDLERFGMTVVPYSHVEGIFDVGIALAPVNNLTQLAQLNAHCARWIVSHFDMIASRSWSLRLSDPLRPLIVELGLEHANRVIALSEFALRDASAFYPRLADSLAERGEATLLGSTRTAVQATIDESGASALSAQLEAAIARGGYVVIAGNSYPHKQVRAALHALESLPMPVIAFGPLDGVASSGSRFVVTSGVLSEDQLRTILENAAVVVFPSAYEGFGLPIADALDFGVPVVAFDTSVAREVVTGLGASDAVRFFGRFSALAATVSDAIADPDIHKAAAALRHAVRDLEPFNLRLIDLAVELTDEPIDPVRLSTRFDTIVQLQQVARAADDALAATREQSRAARLEADALSASRRFRFGHGVIRVVGPLLRPLQRSRRS